MQFSDEFINKWQGIIDSVDITEVPLDCIKKVVIKLEGRKQKTINCHRLRQKGYELDDIEQVITKILCDLDGQILDLNFVVDLPAVAKIVQPETDKILEGL